MAWTDHFADAFVHENVACGYGDVTTLESLTLTPLFLKNSSVRKKKFSNSFLRTGQQMLIHEKHMHDPYYNANMEFEVN